MWAHRRGAGAPGTSCGEHPSCLDLTRAPIPVRTHPSPMIRSSPATPVLASWSGGKDSSLALRAVLADPTRAVSGLLTTVTAGYERISMHGVRVDLLEAQAGALGLPLTTARIPPGASNEAYESAMRAALRPARRAGITEVVFGDLFLADVRAYRERLLAPVGMRGHYPLWGRDTGALAAEFIADGFRAVLVCVDPRQVPAELCGRDFDRTLLADLPAGTDPCGENGEFHTFVYDGPIFRAPVVWRRGAVVERDGFWFCDLAAGGDAREQRGASGEQSGSAAARPSPPATT